MSATIWTDFGGLLLRLQLLRLRLRLRRLMTSQTPSGYPISLPLPIPIVIPHHPLPAISSLQATLEHHQQLHQHSHSQHQSHSQSTPQHQHEQDQDQEHQEDSGNSNDEREFEEAQHEHGEKQKQLRRKRFSWSNEKTIELLSAIHAYIVRTKTLPPANPKGLPWTTIAFAINHDNNEIDGPRCWKKWANLPADLTRIFERKMKFIENQLKDVAEDIVIEEIEHCDMIGHPLNEAELLRPPEEVKKDRKEIKKELVRHWKQNILYVAEDIPHIVYDEWVLPHKLVILIKQCIGEDIEKIIKLLSCIKQSSAIFRKKSKTLTTSTSSLKRTRDERYSTPQPIETTSQQQQHQQQQHQQVHSNEDELVIPSSPSSAKKAKMEIKISKVLEQFANSIAAPQTRDILADFPSLDLFAAKVGLSEAEKNDLINIGVNSVGTLLGLDYNDLEDTSISELHKRAIVRHLQRYTK